MNQVTTTPRAGGRVSIRAARSDDAPQLARLAGELGYPTEADEMRLRLEAITLRSDHAVFVAEHGAPAPGRPSFSTGRSRGPLLGWIHVARGISLESGETAEILGLVVDRGARRDGVGRRSLAWPRSGAARSL